MNDGIQPWYSDRKKFDLRSTGSRQAISSEEGFACINTCVNSRVKLLWNSALVYCEYIAIDWSLLNNNANYYYASHGICAFYMGNFKKI